MAQYEKSDPLAELTKKYLSYFKQDSIELTMPLIADGAYDSVEEVVSHNLGYSPIIIGFINFPAVQTPGGNYTRFFGGSNIQTQISGGNIEVIFAMEEEISSNDTDITFSWKVSNNTGFAQPEITVTIDYFILTRVSPPASS